ncbi:unnamed protein product [Closterium sp. Naga37s-1]|nr:unnamed protein product [Closterium sp. Naga37s-1]CAI5537291.1 unnamed protein product [Closterium sp. Naga37s-1]
MLVRNANPPMPAGKVDPCMFDPKTSPACDPFWEDVAVKYSPQYKFHPEETIWPITIDEYLTHVTESIGQYTENYKTKEIQYQAGPITPDNLDTLLGDGVLKTDRGRTVLLSSREEITKDTDWVKDSAHNPSKGGTKVYTIIYNPKPDDADSFVEIQYWMLYPYNYASILREYNHITDLVAIAIRFSKTGQPQRIWYAQHGDGPVWAWDTGADWNDKKSKNFATVLGTHPIVYVAKGNHEHYPSAAGRSGAEGGSSGRRRRGIEIEGGWEQAQGYMESMDSGGGVIGTEKMKAGEV